MHKIQVVFWSVTWCVVKKKQTLKLTDINNLCEHGSWYIKMQQMMQDSDLEANVISSQMATYGSLKTKLNSDS